MTDDALYLGMLEQGALVGLLREPTRHRFEAATLAPLLFRHHPAHRSIAVAIRHLADAGRLPHHRRVRRLLRSEAAVELLDQIVHSGSACGNVAGQLAELKWARSRGDRPHPVPSARASVELPLSCGPAARTPTSATVTTTSTTVSEVLARGFALSTLELMAETSLPFDQVLDQLDQLGALGNDAGWLLPEVRP